MGRANRKKSYNAPPPPPPCPQCGFVTGYMRVRLANTHEEQHALVQALEEKVRDGWVFAMDEARTRVLLPGAKPVAAQDAYEGLLATEGSTYQGGEVQSLGAWTFCRKELAQVLTRPYDLLLPKPPEGNRRPPWSWEQVALAEAVAQPRSIRLLRMFLFGCGRIEAVGYLKTLEEMDKPYLDPTALWYKALRDLGVEEEWFIYYLLGAKGTKPRSLRE